MNKFILVVSLAVLAVAAFTSAAPSEEVVTKLKELKELVRTTLDEIEAKAIADNPEVGQRIKDKLEELVKKAQSIGEKARAIETPTREQSKELLTNFLALLGKARDEVKDDVKELNAATRLSIVTHFTTGLTKAKEIVKDISAELS